MGLRFIKQGEDINEVFENELKTRKLSRGDMPNSIMLGFNFLKPVLVQNDNYLDCEYQLEYNEKIYSEEQIKNILQELGVL